jgi:hypothetical protein
MQTHSVPLQITSVQFEPNTKNLVIKTTAKSRKARLHFVYRRFIPRTATPAVALGRAPVPYPLHFSPTHTFSRLLSTRSTNPEYQYILNRRGVAQQCIYDLFLPPPVSPFFSSRFIFEDSTYLGNSLPFPSLLLQPTPHKRVISSFNQQSLSSRVVAGQSKVKHIPVKYIPIPLLFFHFPPCLFASLFLTLFSR